MLKALPSDRHRSHHEYADKLIGGHLGVAIAGVDDCRVIPAPVIGDVCRRLSTGPPLLELVKRHPASKPSATFLGAEASGLSEVEQRWASAEPPPSAASSGYSDRRPPLGDPGPRMCCSARSTAFGHSPASASVRGERPSPGECGKGARRALAFDRFALTGALSMLAARRRRSGGRPGLLTSAA